VGFAWVLIIEFCFAACFFFSFFFFARKPSARRPLRAEK